jgi:hypothetical protein
MDYQMASMARIQRQILRSRRRLGRMEEQHGAVFTPRRVWAPRPETIRRLEQDIAALPKTTLYIKVSDARELIKAVRRLAGRQRWLSHRVTSMNQQLRDLRYRMKLTTRVICLGDLDSIARWWLARRGAGGKDLNAVALARAAVPKRKLKDPDSYRNAGKLGAEARWAAHRASQAAQIGRLSGKPSSPSL